MSNKQKQEIMKFEVINYKGFEIVKRIDEKTHCCIIQKNDDLIKCVAGDIAKDGSENSIEKAKKYILENLL
jgi:hypothetical protein